MVLRRDRLMRIRAAVMSKTLVNFWLDTLLLVCFLSVLFSTAVLRFVFPPAAAAEGWTLWGWGFDRWLGCQVVSLSLFTLGALVHVMLHWSWICGVLATRLGWASKASMQNDGIRTLLGVAALIVVIHLLGLGIAAAVLTIRPPGGG
jgi:hypothetical protein